MTTNILGRLLLLGAIIGLVGCGDDGDEHYTVVVEPSGAMCVRSSDCGDGSFCAGEELCLDGRCVVSAPACDEAIQCDEEARTCDEGVALVRDPADSTNALQILGLKVGNLGNLSFRRFDVDFVDSTAETVYGPAPGEYDFTTNAEAEIAVDAITDAFNRVDEVSDEDPILTVAIANPGIGPGEGSGFNVGFDFLPADGADPDFAVVQQGFRLEPDVPWSRATDRDFRVYDAQNIWAVFTLVEALIRDPDDETNVLGILGLEVDALDGLGPLLYDVDFVESGAEAVYGAAPGQYTFSTNRGSERAIDAIIDFFREQESILGEAPILTVAIANPGTGPGQGSAFGIGFDFLAAVAGDPDFVVTQRAVRVEAEIPWARLSDFDLREYDEAQNIWAVFTPVPMRIPVPMPVP